ncbi:MAG: SufS family cysteine desulfurase [Colwellia sp.]|uniref:SufS family cysteine desulfurase n=1 Tax=Pseudoalteromonas sp. S554 TaxID=2066516 RepID=UPI0002318EE4|nr:MULTISPECIES: SufS family cysteine desulfurase [unclassified Pseudoalteromonas]MBL1386053.1 SufS family cysteine desulfurase [Colwellia sp.]MDA8940434.1 SufS family cysteine desulfurase [Pseudoalteromonas marina]TMS80312.1 SufS family cysteine desulfurase [Pseudoalteromonas sp. S554]GAA74196.1 cysteine desulfurase / selenocysteine lyase [Pseudoalteromonas sp. BSi20480]|tara:strand:+ start:252 stop:1478 length:1227 start_codon:yes stop_codon:yes gene_type:complete
MPALEFNINKIRSDFPTLKQQINANPLVYLDSAATTQKPQSVIDAINEFYTSQNANVHRGRHTLSERATSLYEQARDKTAKYFNVSSKEIVWTKGATEAINLVSNGLRSRFNQNDTIIISVLEHHANIVPWQVLSEQTGAKLLALPVNDDGTLNIKQCCDFIKQSKPSMFAITQASNMLGNITNLKPLITAAKEVNSLVLIDGAQGAMHLKPDLHNLNCDFYVCSSHKMLGPTGLGVLYGKYQELNSLDVYQTGGEMIEKVYLTHSTYRPAPAKFETGTPNISGVLGFSAALDYLNALQNEQLQKYEQKLFNYAAEKLVTIQGITIYSNLSDNIGTLSFNFKDEHPYDLATLLDGYGVAVRAGHHCTQPLMTHLGINGTLRASFCFYNTHEDVDIFINSLKECIALLD